MRAAMPIEVVGIDPGSLRTGWGVVREVSGVLELVDCGIIRPPASAKDAGFSDRIARIYRDLRQILARHSPTEAAIEQVFTARNAVSALKLGQARGVAVAACAGLGMAIFDYEPTLVKKSLTGSGRAEKEQVAFMVRRLLNARDADWPLDTSDALAVAICHLSQRRYRELARKAATA